MNARSTLVLPLSAALAPCQSDFALTREFTRLILLTLQTPYPTLYTSTHRQMPHARFQSSGPIPLSCQ